MGWLIYKQSLFILGSFNRINGQNRVHDNLYPEYTVYPGGFTRVLDWIGKQSVILSVKFECGQSWFFQLPCVNTKSQIPNSWSINILQLLFTTVVCCIFLLRKLDPPKIKLQKAFLVLNLQCPTILLVLYSNNLAFLSTTKLSQWMSKNLSQIYFLLLFWLWIFETAVSVQ